MRKATIEYKDDDYDVIISVQQADVRAGIARSTILNAQILASRKQREEHPDKPVSVMERAIATLTYPVCIASTTEIVNNEPKTPKQLRLQRLTLDKFLALPDALALIWEEASLEVNPHWVPKLAAPEGEEKEPVKETSSDAA